MILGVIPARSGSKSVKDKNIRPLGGRPLMAWSIKTALACKQLDKVVVSTDSQKYANLAKFYGADVVMRSKELAEDDTTMVQVLQHAIKEIEKTGNKIDLVVLLDPTSPLKTVEDIASCVRKIQENKVDTVETVTETEHNPIFIMGTVNTNGEFVYLFKKQALSLTRRQDAPKIYRENAAVLVTTRKMVMEKKHLFNGKLMAVIMPQERSVHIDNLIDWKLAESLIKHE